MEQSSLRPHKIDPEQDDRPGRNGDTVDSKESTNQLMIADRLMAPLASGNLDHLAQAREAFLKQAPTSKKKELTPEKPQPTRARVIEARKEFAPETSSARENLTEIRNELVRDTPRDLESLLER